MLMRRCCAVILALFVTQTASSALAAERQILPHRLTALTRSLQTVDRLPATNHLHAALCLPLRNAAGLTNLLSEICNPSSPNYHHYLTPEAFSAQFGPTREDYAAVIAFAQAQGLKVTTMHPNRMLVDVAGTTTDFERTFHTTLRVYRHPKENRTFHAPDVAPSLDLAVPLRSVCGLDDYALPRPAGLHPMVAATPAGGTGPGGSLMGANFRAAYAPGVALTGAGQSIGLVQFDGYYASDIASYARQANIPSVPLQNVLLDGVTGDPGANNMEVAMDIEMSMSMAPGLDRIIVYEGLDPISILNRMATDNIAKQLSSSWTWGTQDPAYEQVFLQFAAQGQSYFNASGDSDAYPGWIGAPSDDPNITIVGGTTLTTAGNGAWASETTWNWGYVRADAQYEGSGGGISTAYTIPFWQQGVSMTANHGSTSMRNIPDVAMAADNIWVIYNNGSTGAFGGTSAATPLWAAFTALINQQAAAKGHPSVGFLNPALYALGAAGGYGAAFHDITTGNNFNSSSPANFPAVAGYDLCTGWGTPTGQPLIDALTGPPDPLTVTPALEFTASGAVGGPFNVTAQTYTLTNSSATALTWTCETAADWLSVSTGSGTLSPGDAASVTVSLNATASNLVAGIYNATVLLIDVSSGITQSRVFTLRVGQPLVQNGDFETGDFAGWNQSGDTSYDSVSDSTPFMHTGAYGAEMGASLSLSYLSQNLATMPGQIYQISFWLENPYDANGNTPNECQVSWNGNLLFDQVNMGARGWTNVQMLVAATDTTSVIQFGFRNHHAYFGFDDMSVTAITGAVALTVLSAHDGAVPGNSIVLSGTPLTERITNSPVINGATQYLCTGANVAGNDFTQVNPTNVTLTLTNSATLTWNWQTQYRLTTAISGSGTVTPGGWQVAGTSVVLTATAGSTAHFSTWSGNTNGCRISSNQLTASMTQARSITAVFASGAPPVISGKISKSGTSSGVPGVQMTFSGLSTVITASNGTYSLRVPFSWTGTVTPSTNGLSGGAFSPVSRAYGALKVNNTLNFIWIPPPTISGKVTKSGTTTGVAGVQLTFSGLGTIATASNGTYTLTVPYNWTGTVTPATNGLSGGIFAPASKAYAALKAIAANQNYSWTPPPVISGRVTRYGTSTGATNVTLTISGVGTTNTDASGKYFMTVPYHWTGTVTPSSSASGTFSPANKVYSNVIANKTAQNFTWTVPMVLLKPAAAMTSISLSPVELLHTTGLAHWSGAAAKQVWQAPELLVIDVSDGEARVILPVATNPDDLQANVVLEPALPATGLASEGVLIIRNHYGAVVTDTHLPYASVLGTVTFLPFIDTVSLTWDLVVTKP